MGGTYDPTTKQMVWSFSVPLEEQRAHYRAHPPTCLDGLRATPIELPDFPFDGHGEPVNAVFELACTCGNETFALTGWVSPDDDDIGPPVVLTCEACEKDHDLFDPAKHGHDAVVGSAAPRDGEPEGHPDDFPEPPPPYEVIVRFELASDVLGGDQHGLRGREHDAFTWITIIARMADGELTTLLEWECA